MLEPKLYTIAIPILNMKNTGTRKESINTARTILVSTHAITTYASVSCCVIFLVSVTTADIPLIKH